MRSRSLHFILTPVGSSGDFHPYVGIGSMLRKRGHDVSMIAMEPYREVTENAGIDFVQHGTAEEFNEAKNDPDLWHPTKGLSRVLGLVADRGRQQYELIESLYQPGRSVLVGHMLSFATRCFEEKHDAPCASIVLAPCAIRSLHEIPAHAPGKSFSWLPRPIKRMAWWGFDMMLFDRHIEPQLNAFRAEIGLPPVHRICAGWVHSPRCIIGTFPRWFGPPAPDWPAHVHVTGFPLFDEADQREPDPRLAAFLAAGNKPIAFTPGSANIFARPFFEAAVDACQRLGRRGLLLTPHDPQVPENLPDTILHVKYAPFSKVLPRCAAIAHHGGVGTCGQSFAAGIPQLIMPLGFDQPDNVTRLMKLGVGAGLLPKHFKGPRVAAALRSLLDSKTVAEACDRYAQKIRESNANERTCDIIEGLAARPANAA